MVRLIKQQTNGTDLLAQYRASGAPEVFAQIMRAYGGMVFSVCLKVTKDPADAEDASQATFLTLAVQCKTGAVITYLGPWLKKVAKRTALDLVRSRKRRTRRETITAENRPEHYGIKPCAGSEHNELSQIIRTELDQLPAKYRMPLVLHYFGGLSHDQISREMQCTTAALGVRLHRGRKMLGKRLSARGVSLEGVALTTAIAGAVAYVISDRFIQNTTSAMLAITTPARPALFAPAVMHAQLPALPHGLEIVPQLVQEVAQSMARHRMRMATLAIGLSVTMLGGAAEAVRHLPDSVRPNLEFLAPSNVLRELLTPSTPAPRLQLKAPDPGPGEPSTIASIASPEAPPAPPLPVPAPVRMHPVLASQRLPTLPPPIVALPAPSTYAPSASSTAAAPVAMTTTPTQVPSAPARATSGDNAPVVGGASGSSSRKSNAQRAGPPIEVPAPAHPTTPVVAAPQREPGTTPIQKFVASGATPASSNLEKVAKPGIGALSTATPDAFTASFTSAVPTLAGVESGQAMLASIGPVPLQTFDPTAHNLRACDIVITGDGDYSWSDARAGILPGEVNSVDLHIDGVEGMGVISIERLPVNTLLAPERPTGHTFIGIWSLDERVLYEQLTMKVRYDYALAESLGLREDVLKLWVYRDSNWLRITDLSFQRHLEEHALSGAITPGGAFFAVSAPEPTSVMVGLSMGAMALLRRRRRAPR